jgi:hypothetical protein
MIQGDFTEVCQPILIFVKIRIMNTSHEDLHAAGAFAV